MRIAIILIAILSVWVSFAVTAKEDSELIPYKCHIETPNGADIALFVWDPKLLIEEQSDLLADYASTISNERLLVKRIIECIAEDKQFKDVFIREMDEQRTY
ncbi:TapY2 family type IVa secretion system protein [Shewanella frigidimarina]|uniref:TapY2 family type IVa secretion system protein n=1 Tax=Shewanella frigidimarina TaxID=56812 RepID=UPI003D7AE3D6